MDTQVRNELIGASLNLYKKPRIIIEANLTAIYLVLSGQATLENVSQKLEEETNIKHHTAEMASRFVARFLRILANEDTRKQIQELKEKAEQEGLEKAKANLEKANEEVQ
jgi:hypothetical protein